MPINIFRTVMEFIPSYTFSMVFGLLCGLCSSRFDVNSANWIAGRKFTDDDYFAPYVFRLDAINTTVVAPSIGEF